MLKVIIHEESASNAVVAIAIAQVANAVAIGEVAGSLQNATGKIIGQWMREKST